MDDRVPNLTWGWLLAQEAEEVPILDFGFWIEDFCQRSNQ
jgi:hypothetical protein